LPDPVPGEGEVLIKVAAAGLNRSDVYSRSSDRYGGTVQGPEIPGLEVSGWIEKCGPGVTRWQKGDAVCSLVTGGGYAELVVVPAGQCMRVPAGVDIVTAASLPETIMTVWQNVFRTGALKAGEHLLVHGGSSGIGVSAIQMGKAFGAKVYVTAGTKDKCLWCEVMGAEYAVNYKTEDFEEVLKDVGIDVILDMTGGDFVPKNIRLLRMDGRIVFINSMRGRQAQLDLAEIMRKRVVLTGSHLKTRDAAFKAGLAAEVEEKVWPVIERGAYKPFVYKVFPLAQAADAQRLMESGEHRGKILLSIS
jgi:putative PIG3 family NAD(P)H quinone oxidoreductase